MSAHWISWITFLGSIGLIIGLGLFTPRWSPPGYWFGVVVPAAFERTDSGRAALAAFRIRLLALGAVALGASILAGVLRSDWLAVVAPFVAVAGMFWGYARAHRLVRPHALPESARRTASLRPSEARVPSLAWHLGAVLILAAAGMYLGLRWDDIPPRFPIHWDAQGNANGWGTRTPLGVFWGPVFGVALVVGMVGLSAALSRATRRGAPGLGAEVEARQRTLTAWILLATNYFIAVLFGGLSLLPLAAEPGRFVTWTLVLSLLFVAGLIVAVVRYGRKVRRLHAGAVALAGEDRHWKWGLVYVNPDDPAVLIPKRFGIGYTVNFGNRVTWLLLALIVAPEVILVIALRSTTR